MKNKFFSIDMKYTTTKLVLELKGELRLICYAKQTWEVWTTFFDTHNEGDIVNPKPKEKISVEKDQEAPQILRQFFQLFQGLA